jgi:plastocyanin
MGLIRKTGAVLALALTITCAAVSADAYQSETVTHGGTITGTVKYEGAPPKPQQLDISKDRDVCGTRPQYEQSLIVGKGGGIANAIVSLPDIAKGKPLNPNPAVTFDQKGCEYIPHVAAFSAGSTVDILNSDGILHNIHTESTSNPLIDIAQPGFKKEIKVTIEKPEAIRVSCDAHNWMVGWWYVAPNPYFAKTNEAGTYTITDVPPGTYTIRIWQEKLGTESRKVTVKADATTTADFTMTARGAPAKQARTTGARGVANSEKG